MPRGPQPMTREERLALAREIADRARASRGEDVLAEGPDDAVLRRVVARICQALDPFRVQASSGDSDCGTRGRAI